MKLFSHALRLGHIILVFVKHGFDEWLLRTHLGPLLRQRAKKTRGRRLREILETLGPIFVKFGQLLSTRSDMVPYDIVTELATLQDQVTPFPGALAKNLIETTFDRSILEIFESFDNVPLASASIAQVHSAVLRNGQTVVVKVLRPNIHAQIQKDIALLSIIASLIHRCSKKLRAFKPREMVAEFARSLLDELDFMKEAANASQLKRNFKQSSVFKVPKIHWDLTRRNILVMERMYGLPLTNIDKLKQEGFHLKRLAERIIEIFFIQVFRDSFFHADMHPGNLLIASESHHDPVCIALDFGIMGILSIPDQRYLAENLLAFFRRDYQRVAELHIESGWISPSTRIDAFESAIRAVSEPIFERSKQEISFGELLLRLFQMATRFQVNIQPQLLLLQKTLMNIESLSRQLYPEIDIFETAKPFLEQWVKNQVGWASLRRKLKRYGPYWIEKLPEIPNLFHAALSNVAKICPTYPMQTSTVSTPEPRKNKSTFKDIGIGLLLGIGLNAAWMATKSYFYD